MRQAEWARDAAIQPTAPPPAAAAAPSPATLTRVLLHGSITAGRILKKLVKLLGRAAALGAAQLLALIPVACQRGRRCLQLGKLLPGFVALLTQRSRLLLHRLQLLLACSGSPSMLQAGL